MQAAGRTPGADACCRGDLEATPASPGGELVTRLVQKTVARIVAASPHSPTPAAAEACSPLELRPRPVPRASPLGAASSGKRPRGAGPRSGLPRPSRDLAPLAAPFAAARPGRCRFALPPLATPLAVAAAAAPACAAPPFRPNPRTGFRGVYPCGDKIQASVWLRGSAHGCGTFLSAEEAARAFDAKARKLGFCEDMLNYPHGQPRPPAAAHAQPSAAAAPAPAPAPAAKRRSAPAPPTPAQATEAWEALDWGKELAAVDLPRWSRLVAGSDERASQRAAALERVAEAEAGLAAARARIEAEDAAERARTAPLRAALRREEAEARVRALQAGADAKAEQLREETERNARLQAQLAALEAEDDE